MKTAVIGAGAWGTALAKVAHSNGGDVCLWGRDAGALAALGQAGRNERYLPGVDLPRDLPTEADLAKAVDGAGCVVLAIPSRAFREVTARLPEFDGVAVSVTKGIEFDTGLTMGGVLGETMPLAKVAALSGPTLALEVCRDMPSAAVAAVSCTARVTHAGTGDTPACARYTLSAHTGNSRCRSASLIWRSGRFIPCTD